MVLSVVAKIKVKDGQQAAFEAVAGKLAAAVNANEPGCLLYTLNKLNSDSELIVMNATGVAPKRLTRPFVVLTLVTAALVGWMSLSVMPAGFRSLRDLITLIRADFVANVVKEGQFVALLLEGRRIEIVCTLVHHAGQEVRHARLVHGRDHSAGPARRHGVHPR